MIEATRDLVRRWLEALLHVHDTPERTAAAYALGVFLGFSPFLGLHTVVAIALAFILNFNRVAVLLGVYSNLPWILVPYYAFTTMAGAAILRTETPTDLRERLTAIFALSVRNAEFWHELVRLIRPLFWPYMLGSLIGATVLSFVAYRVALEFVVRRRRHHALHHPPKPPSQP
ncbi:MAG: DUF2062 domain-containing protein [Acidobacteria bacterium]|nr:DUF2062 domain-containing protein [Acidobacteriota bacterium]